MESWRSIVKLFPLDIQDVIWTYVFKDVRKHYGEKIIKMICESFEKYRNMYDRFYRGYGYVGYDASNKTLVSWYKIARDRWYKSRFDSFILCDNCNTWDVHGVTIYCDECVVCDKFRDIKSLETCRVRLRWIDQAPCLTSHI